MKLKILGLDHDLTIEESTVSVLEILDRRFFQKFILNLYKMISGEEGEDYVTLFDTANPLTVEKEVFMVLDILNLYMNDKKVKKDLIVKLHDIYLQQAESIELWNHIESNSIRLAENIMEEFSLPLEYDELEVSDFLKLLNFVVAPVDTGSFTDHLMGFVDLVEAFNLYRVLIFVNIKSYLQDEEIVELYKYCTYKKVRLIIIEGTKQTNLLEYEKKLRINEDFTDELLYNRM